MALFVLFLIAYLQNRLNFQIEQWDHARLMPARIQAAPPEPETARAISLNHSTLAADIVWVWALLYHGEQTDARNVKYLEQFANTVADLDPYFHDIYLWFSAAYITSRYPASHEDLERVNRFLDRGIEYFPTDFRLPRDAGLNYIGYSAGRSDRIRIEELTSGIQYLQRAAKLDGAPEVLPFTISWMYQRRQQLLQKLEGNSNRPEDTMSEKQIEFFAEMYYLVDSGMNRQRIRSKLMRTKRGRQALSRSAKRYSELLQIQRHKRLPYLPVGLWTLVIKQRL